MIAQNVKKWTVDDKRELRLLMRKYKRMSNGFKHHLGKYGLVVTPNGSSHYRVTNINNGKYGFISSTPSDYRSRKYEACRICKLLD